MTDSPKPSDSHATGPSPEDIAYGYSLADLLNNSSSNVPADWIGIARQVAWRKRLLMAATDELRKRGIEHAFKLATVDVFVEKAQDQLTQRAELYRKWGMITSAATLTLLLGAVVLLSLSPVREHVIGVQTENWRQLVLGLFRTSTLAGFYVGAIIFLVFLSRALLHEMTVLYQRRHALRFGRLFVYLHPENISVEDLHSAFNWNVEYRSAFKDIRGDRLVQGPAAIIGSAVGLAQKGVEVVKEARTKP